MANGLTSAEEKKLSKMLRQLEQATTRAFLGGGREAREMYALIDTIKLRQNPPTVQAIEDRLNALAELHRGIDWFEAAMAVA